MFSDLDGTLNLIEKKEISKECWKHGMVQTFIITTEQNFLFYNCTGNVVSLTRLL